MLNWFKSLKNKQSLRFVKFDVCNFYPTIKPELLNKALVFAEKFIKIPKRDISIILQSRETFLFNEGQPWVKQKGLFDVAMGSFDGAECCELIGLYMLSKLTEGKFALFHKSKIGLYRDDGSCLGAWGSPVSNE